MPRPRRRGRPGRYFLKTCRKRAFFVLLAIAVAVAIYIAAWWVGLVNSGYPTGPSVRIASWNLRHFGTGRAELDLTTIARIIDEGQFDLVAIQEVHGSESVERLIEYLPTTDGRRWQVLLSEPTGNGERMAFIYDAARIEFLGEAGFLPSRLEIDRRPYAARFRAQTFDFTLVNIHLYYSDLTRRRGEAARLAETLHKVIVPSGTGERDVIVIGDFNTTRRKGGTLTPFESRGWTASIDSPTNLGDSEVFDNAVFDRDFVREWSGRSGVVRFDEALFGNDDAKAARAVSDHRPIWVDFVINLGDDD